MVIKIESFFDFELNIKFLKMLPIFKLEFKTSEEALNKCQQMANKQGFSIRIRTSKPNTIYLVCSKEGLPESKQQSNNNKKLKVTITHFNMDNSLNKNISEINTIQYLPKRQRNRNSDRCKCNWRIILFRNQQGLWEFRGGRNMSHNHTLLEPNQSSKKLNSSIIKTEVKNTQLETTNEGTKISLPSLKSLMLPLPTIKSTSEHWKSTNLLPPLIRNCYSSDTSTLMTSPHNELSKTMIEVPLTSALSKIMTIEPSNKSNQLPFYH